MNKINQPKTFIFIVLCSLTCVAQEQKRCEPASVFDYDDDQTLTVEAKDLLTKPKCYDGMFVRTIGFYFTGFEVSRLFCLDCPETSVAWINTGNFYAAMKRCTSTQNLKKLSSKEMGTYGVVILGVLNTKLGFNEQAKDIGSKRLSDVVARGGYGHMNAYDSEFSPICFEHVEAFSNAYMSQSAAGEKTRKQMSTWYARMYQKL
jgi:hypothetical protein